MRAPRLVRLLLLLQSRGRLTAAQLAAELEVSERTVYRDLADLGGAGVPVVGERGAGGGYHLLDGYRTNLTGLTPDEAEALLLTGAAAPLAAVGLGAHLAAARLKLLAAVPTPLREIAVRAEQRFHLDPSGWAHAMAADEGRLAEVAAAVWHDRRLRIVHRASDGRVSERTLDPLGLVHKTGNWYLVAARAGEPRVYRVDRIHSARPLAEPAARPAGFDLAAFWARWEAAYAATLPVYRVRAKLGPLARRYRDALGALSPRAVVEDAPDGDGWAYQELVFDDLRTAVAALLALSPEVEVLAPVALRAELAAIAGRVAARHGE
jgi:predicted DNA-binding transcriptional regulator YafY